MTMQSSKLSYYSFKYSLKFVSIVFIVIIFLGYLFPEHSKFNGKPGPPNLVVTIIFLGIALLFFFLGELLSRKLVRVEVDNDSLKIHQHDSVKQVKWEEVERIKRIYFVHPPLYKLKIKNKEETYLFNTGYFYLLAFGFMKDLSKMGQFIARKKKDFGI